MYNSMKITAILIMVIGFSVSQATSGIKYENDKGYVKLGGRIQLQYHITDPDGGESTDELIFRRLRPYIEGSVHENWKGKFQFDLGKSKIALKDAYVKYTGFEFMNITFGNANFAFSRELLTSSKKQQLVERTFVGDHNYGTPDRQVGLHLNGTLLKSEYDKDAVLKWNLAVAKAAIDPSNKKLDFDSVAQIDAGSDWIEGDMIGGRLEFFPMGKFKASQGDFGSDDLNIGLAVGAFSWDNDGDYTNMDELGTISDSDVDSVTGLELSGAIRFAGLSVDAEYNMFESELVNGAAGINNLYKDGETTLENYAIEGGYMVIPSRLELVAGYENQDADGYSEEWTRTSIGANIFVSKHKIKYQATYRIGENKDGKDGNDVDEVFVQAQYVF